MAVFESNYRKLLSGINVVFNILMLKKLMQLEKSPYQNQKTNIHTTLLLFRYDRQKIQTNITWFQLKIIPLPWVNKLVINNNSNHNNYISCEGTVQWFGTRFMVLFPSAKFAPHFLQLQFSARVWDNLSFSASHCFRSKRISSQWIGTYTSGIFYTNWSCFVKESEDVLCSVLDIFTLILGKRCWSNILSTTGTTEVTFFFK